MAYHGYLEWTFDCSRHRFLRSPFYTVVVVEQAHLMHTWKLKDGEMKRRKHDVAAGHCTLSSLVATDPHTVYVCSCDDTMLQKGSIPPGELIRLSLTITTLRATALCRRFFGGAVPLVGNGYLSHTARGMPLFMYFIGKMMVALTFADAKIQNQSRTFFQDFDPWKETLRFRNSKWLDQKFRKEIFRIPYQKLDAQNFLIQSVQFCARETACGPEQTLFWDGMGWTWVAGSTCDISPTLNTTTTNLENFMPSFLLGAQKKLFQNFRSTRFGWTTQESFFRDKNPGRLRVTFFWVFATAGSLAQTA